MLRTLDGMSRPLRLHVPGVLLHVFTRGNNRARIFIDDHDCASFLEMLSTTLDRFGVECVMYCLLHNHYHLLVIPHQHPISRAMQHLNARYCRIFNRRHARVGHVLQGRFGSRLVADREYAREVMRYVARNPVAPGLAAAPDAWRWSSYRALLGLETQPPFLASARVWAAFGTSDPEVGRARLAEFVGADVRESFPNPLLYGGEPLARQISPALEPHQSNRDFAYPYRFAACRTLASLLDGCGTRTSLEDAAHAAFNRHGYTLAAIGEAIGRDPSTICRWIQRAEARRSAAAGMSPKAATVQETRSDPGDSARTPVRVPTAASGAR